MNPQLENTVSSMIWVPHVSLLRPGKLHFCTTSGLDSSFSNRKQNDFNNSEWVLEGHGFSRGGEFCHFKTFPLGLKPRTFAAYLRHDSSRALSKPGSPATGLRRWGGKPGSPATGLHRWGGKPGCGISRAKPSARVWRGCRRRGRDWRCACIRKNKRSWTRWLRTSPG